MAEIGRPTVFTETTLQKLEEAFSMGCTDNEACLYADISASSLYNYQRENQEFLKRKEVLKDKPILLARTTVLSGIKRDPDLALRFLERKKKDEFSLKTETEHSGTIIVRPAIWNGDQDSSQLLPSPVSTRLPEGSDEIQDSSMAPESGQIEDGTQRTDQEDTAS